MLFGEHPVRLASMTEATVTDLADFRHLRASGEAEWVQPARVRPGVVPAALPTGTVTFLLSDVEDSTSRWEARPDRMTEAVTRHFRLLDAAVAAHGGVRPVEQGEGDSMVAAFARASDAVAAALEAQRAITSEPWPEGAEIAVRLALHTGEARLRDELYYAGPSIIRCARLRSLGHGGQTLVSATTADLLADDLPDEASLLPLGVHRLKGLRLPERVFQLIHPDLPARFPPLRSLDVLPVNLPAQLTSFVGREGELAQITDVIAAHRLVTLAGAGGTGKTRLAGEAASGAAGAFPDGVWWVDLAPLRDPGFVPRTVMTAIGLDGTHVDPVGRIVTFLGDRTVLLVLDNCEHVVAAAADFVAGVLKACPRAAVLATSREPLGVAGEVVWRVPPLTLPPPTDPQPVTAAVDDVEIDGILGSEAVQLFAERAGEARPGFSVDRSNAATVAQICARLDGLPLAIELAAARVRSLTPERILDGLAQRFTLLTGGARGGTAHQQTLAASMAWSYELLSEQQQVLLRRLAAFTGRFTLADVEAVTAAEPLSPWECLVVMADLVDRSLVAFDGQHYRLLQTVAAFAADRLAEAGEEAAIRAAHAAHYGALVAATAAALEAGPQTETLEQLEVARANVLAAIDHTLTVGEHEAALQMTADMAVFWQMHGRYGESLMFLRRVLAATPAVPSRARALVLYAAGQLSLFGMDLANGYGLAEAGQAVEMAEATGASDVLGRALAMRDVVKVFACPAEAIEPLAHAREVATAGGDRFGANLATAWRGLAATFGVDDAGLAEEDLARLAAEAEATRSPYWASWSAICRGFAALRTGRLREAVAILAPAEQGALEFGDSQLEFFAAMPLADAYVDLGDTASVEALVSRSVEWQDRSAFGRGEYMLVRRARAWLAEGDVASARAELTRVEKVLRSIGFDITVAELLLITARAEEEQGDLAAARAALEEAAELAATLGFPWYVAWAANTEGRLARAEGRPAAAEEAHHRALTICGLHGYAGRATEVLECLASLAVEAQSWAEAARLYGAARALRVTTGQRRPPLDMAQADADAAALAKALGSEDYAEAIAQGEALSLDEAVAYVSRARGERKRPASGWESLTPTEQDVVALVAEGLTNADIGRRMFITTGTVKVHLHNVFAKLGISRRSELAAQATERRLTDR